MCATVLLGLLAMAGAGPAAHALPEPVSQRSATPSPAAGAWKCWWAPTMDQNWHNDALCSNGASQVRPYLRPADTYITRAELMSSAQAWARARNRR